MRVSLQYYTIILCQPSNELRRLLRDRVGWVISAIVKMHLLLF